MVNLLLSVLSISLTTSVVIIALILLGSLINKRYVAKWKYGLWIVLSLRLLVPFNYKLPDVPLQITIPTEVGSVEMSELFETKPSFSEVQPIDPQITASLPAEPQAVAPLSPTVDTQGESEVSLTLLQALAYLWATVAAGLFIWHLTGYYCFRRRVKKWGSEAKNSLLSEQLHQLCRELGVRRQIPILISKKADSPMIMGFWRPILVLPEEEHTREESYYILKHELIHYKRRDILVKFMLLLARDIHWFNPVVYLMHREAVVDMEIACDEAVVRGGSFAQREAYSETLMSNLHRQRHKGPLLSTQFSCGKRVMKKRFRNILTKVKKKNGVILFLFIFVLSATAGTLANLVVEASDTDEIRDEGATDPNVTEVKGVPEVNLEAGESTAAEITAGFTREPATVLTLIKEGFEEEEPATLYIGEGYSFYLIDDQWVMTEPGHWYAKVNENVRFWIDRYEDMNLNQVKEMLAEQGYSVEGEEPSGRLYKYEADTDTVNRVLCYETGSDVWTMSSVHSLEGEEGWAVNIKAMFDTFAVTGGYEGRGLSAGQSDDVSNLNFLMYGYVSKFGLGTLVYTVPDAGGEDYKLYFFLSENEEDRLDEMSFDLSKAFYVFPDVREGNAAIGKFKEIYFMDTADVLQDGTQDIIVIAVYEKDGNEYYDTRVYEERENGYVVNTALTQELNEKYFNVEDYPIQDIVALPGEPADYKDPELEDLMTLFYTAYFNKDIDTIEQCLAEDYQGNVSFMSEVSSLEEVEILEIKGWKNAVNLGNIGDECELSLEFILPNEDSLTYLTVDFIKEDTGWKIRWYGLEK